MIKKAIKKINKIINLETAGILRIELTEVKNLLECEIESDELKSICCLGENHPCMLNVNKGYCRARGRQYKVLEIL